MRRFSFYRRGKIWYVQIFNEKTKKYLPGRSTGETNRNAAAVVVAGWLRDGLPEPGRAPRPVAEVLDVSTVLEAIHRASLTPPDAEKIVSALKARELIETAVVKAGPGSEGFIAYLSRFWDFEKSPYVRDKHAHGQRIGRRHCYDMNTWIRTYWKKYFGERRLSEIHKIDLKKFSLWLAETGTLRAKTINNILSAGTVALRWAAENELIARNPAEGLMKFSGKAARRGVLTEGEAGILFTVPWADERARIGNVLAMSTGLRAGEVLAL
jgi:hypothetical protein